MKTAAARLLQREVRLLRRAVCDYEAGEATHDPEVSRAIDRAFDYYNPGLRGSPDAKHVEPAVEQALSEET